MNGPQNDKRYVKMNGAFMASLIIHAVVIVVAIVGLPYLKHDRKIPETVTVELATVADMTQTNKPPVKAPEPEEKKEEPPKPVEQKQPPKAVTNTAKEPPKPVEKKPEPKPEKVEKAKKEPTEIDENALPKKVEKKPEKKPDPKKVEKKPDEKFSSLLKNWAKNEPEQKTDIKDVTDKLAKPTPSPETTNLSDKMTISDIDALRQQLSGCWNILGGAEEAQDMSVDVRVIVNPDRTVQQASIMDQSRYNADDRFRAAADSALRAVRDPRCSPLNVPPDKYAIWHDMVINFNPKDMF